MDASSLGRLSPEIRNTIYEMIIEPDYDYDEWDCDERLTNLHSIPSITRVCSQMREESLPMYLNDVVFQVELYYDAARFPGKHWHAIDIDDFASWLDALPDGHYSLLNLAMELSCDFETEHVKNPAPWNWRASADPELWSQFEKSLERLAEVLGRRGCRPYPLGGRGGPPYQANYEIELEYFIDRLKDSRAAKRFLSKAFKKFGIRLGN